MGRIKNLILGSEGEHASVKEVGTLGKEKSKRQLAYDEQTRFDNAFSAWIKLRARQALIGGGLAAAGLTGYLLLKDLPENEEKPKETSSLESKVEQTNTEAKYRQLYDRGFAMPDIQKSVEAPKIDEADLQQRFREKKAWLKTLEDLVKKTKNPEAKTVLDFVWQNGIVGLPRTLEGKGLGIQVLEKPESELWFNFVPLVKEDEALGGAWRQYTATSIETGELGAVANFLPDIRAIIVKGNAPMSDTFKGIIFVHEGFHAKTYLTTPYNWQDRYTFCQKERDAHEFENGLMVQLGGTTYQAVLEDEVRRMNTILTTGGSKVGEAHVGRAPYDSRLEEAFGPSLSEYEKDTRGTHVWIHANFEMIERAFPNPIEAEKEKAELYCSILPPDFN